VHVDPHILVARISRQRPRPGGSRIVSPQAPVQWHSRCTFISASERTDDEVLYFTAEGHSWASPAALRVHRSPGRLPWHGRVPGAELTDAAQGSGDPGRVVQGATSRWANGQRPSAVTPVVARPWRPCITAALPSGPGHFQDRPNACEMAAGVELLSWRQHRFDGCGARW
jgi:hypothetical protein